VSLVGFKARNHPQQLRIRGAHDGVDDRCTPDILWQAWNEEFGFTLDAASSHTNAKCEAHFTIDDDGLAQSWAGQRVWVNPPFSDCAGWVQKAWYEVTEGGCPLVVMLLPANRTEQGWWQEMVEPFRDRPGSVLSTRFIARRINFATSGNPGAKYASSAPFGCVLLIFDHERERRGEG